MERLFRNVRGSLRILAKKPGFTVVAVIVLAFGIAANTAIFSVVHGVLLRALPYRQDDRVVTVWQSDLKRGVEREETSPADFLDWRQQSQSFESLAMAEPFGHFFIGGGEPEAIRSWVVSAGFFETLGTEAMYGRTFLPEEYQTGSSPVVVLGYGLWQRRFGADPNLVGQKLVLNNQPTTVVGIMPPEFQFPPGRELWAPRPGTQRDPQIRGATYIKVVGRLKADRTVAQAQQEMNSIAARLAEQYPQTNAGVGAALLPLREYLIGQVRTALLVLFGAVGLVLLIACANVANLLLARATERRREFAIRNALGASRWRIVRQLLTESLVLAGLGGVGGVLLASWLIDLIVALSAGNLPRLEQINLNPVVLIFALGISVLTALFFGLAPALQAARPDLQEALKEGTHAASDGRKQQRFRHALVVTQVAVAFVLLVGAGLLVRSFVALLWIEPGFVTDRALTLEVQLARRTPDQRVAFLDQTLDKLAALPGVQAAGATSALPLHDNQVVQPTTIKIQGRPSAAPEGDATANLITVTPDYFRALGIPLLGGRLLTRFDQQNTPVAVINRAMALRHWPAEDPIGKKISFQTFGGSFTVEIVGVVGDARTAGLERQPNPEVFVSHASQIGYSSSMTYFVRTATDPLSLLPAVKEKIREVNKNQTFSSTATIEQLLDRSLGQRRFLLFLLSTFALLALILAGVGIYGLVSFSTARRTHEIGVRMALGAQTSDVLRLIIRQGVRPVLIGVGLGWAGALALTRLMTNLLYRVQSTDPLTLFVISLLLVGVALIACYLPARRATKVDPMIALRYE